jgi:uncharacterized coiled-coil protein SlyX
LAIKFVKLIRFLKESTMKDGLQSRLERLEVLYSEQDYTMQTLNDTISQQDREIAKLTLVIEQLRLQIQSLRAEVAGDIDPGFEQPPHY